MASCVSTSSRRLIFPSLDRAYSLRSTPPPHLARLHLRFASTASTPRAPTPAPSAPSTPPRPPSVEGTQPLVLYEGPPREHPRMSWFLFGSFSLIGLTTGYNLSQHLAWPLWSLSEAELVDPSKRYAVGFFVASMCIATASVFKYAPTHNIIRITLFEDPSKGPMLKILTATRPIFPRGFFRRAVRPAIAKDHGKREFIAPLENVVRRRGSAVAQGWVDERTGGVERRVITIDVGGDAYFLEGSGANKPIRGTLSRTGYLLKYVVWKVMRGSPSAPYFWSRQAFDELIPQSSTGTKRTKTR